MIIMPDAPWIFFFAALLLDLVVAVVFACGNISKKRHTRIASEARTFILGLIDTKEPGQESEKKADRFIRRYPWIVLEESSRLTDSIDLDIQAKEKLSAILVHNRIDIRLIRDLHSKNRYRMMRSAAYLPLVASKNIRVSLIHALETEKRSVLKLSLVACLTEIDEPLAIPSIIDSLAGESMRYQRAVWGLLSNMGDDLATLVPFLSHREEKEIQLLLVFFASKFRSKELLGYLLGRADCGDLDVFQAAFRVLSTEYASDFDHARFLTHDDFLIRNLAAESLGRFPTARSLILLFDHMDDPVIRKSVALAITSIIRKAPEHFRTLLIRYQNERRPSALATLIEVFSGYVDYLVEKLLSPDAGVSEEILFDIMKHGKLSEVLNFVNRNSNPGIEGKLITIFKKLIREQPELSEELGLYLDERFLRVLKLERKKVEARQEKQPERPNLLLLYCFLLIGVLLVPVVCIAFIMLLSQSPGSFPEASVFIERFFVYFTSAFAIYAGTLNASYVVLLCFSFFGVRAQAKIATLMRSSFMFKENILPSISIISPAFNEEASIVQSVNALITLRYPDYEIIVVNDGSTDKTLARLVEYFDLERSDVFVHKYLDTQPIRGIYANKRYPELLVIDKANGGKADSLNAGINVARKEYFAGIDADSLLEHDALLNLAALFLVSDKEVVAVGGNIFPVNGCTVSKGALIETRIPEKRIARFQTIEYIRSFMAGRVGWATGNLLLIISGAFGVFHRRKVVDAHGYLTRSGHYMRDTVGEDMELVVRLTRVLRENRTPYSIGYSYNANCWTEIPESMRVLVRQRDRWQRGLLEIMSFHSRMLFNPAYGKVGLIGFPYFLLFEAIGPWFEAEGYIVLIIALAFGLVGLPLFLVVFTTTVLMGLFVSTASMIIAEHGKSYFSLGDKLRLIWYAVAENFGFRQFMSILRVRGFIRMLARVGGWGKMERTGFKTGSNKA